MHPTEKPVELLTQIISAAPGAVVFDPFMGSGPVLRAAKDLGMSAIGIDCELEWCRYAAARLAGLGIHHGNLFSSPHARILRPGREGCVQVRSGTG